MKDMTVRDCDLKARCLMKNTFYKTASAALYTPGALMPWSSSSEKVNTTMLFQMLTA